MNTHPSFRKTKYHSFYACLLLTVILLSMTQASADFIHNHKSTTEHSRLYSKLPDNTVSPDFDRHSKNLLKSLFAYDDIRLKITDVLSVLVNEYQLTDEYKNKLLGYRSTFLEQVKPSRDNITTLDEFKAYSHSYSIVYVALVYTINGNKSFHASLAADMTDPNTTIGEYVRELKSSYKILLQAEDDYKKAVHFYAD